MTFGLCMEVESHGSGIGVSIGVQNSNGGSGGFNDLPNPNNEYQTIINQLQLFNSQIATFEDGYKHKVQYLPSYNEKIQAYEKEPLVDHQARKFMLESVIPKLNDIANSEDPHNVDALVTLGDIYTFGNYSMTSDYPKALEYYERAITIKSHGHAYFMLGFIYSTGMFGEIPVNQPKSQLYYQLAVENDDVNALMVMAYKLSEGIDVPKNDELALVYYSRLAQFGYEFYKANEDEIEPAEISFDVKLPDFIGGIYGDDVSESIKSVATSKKAVLESYDHLQYYETDAVVDLFDSKMIHHYFHALHDYDGYYDTPKDYGKAKDSLEQCIEVGKKLPTYKKLSSMSFNDKIRLSKCFLLLGHMYMKGQGVEKDYHNATELFHELIRFFNDSDALSDLGYIYEKGLLDEPDLAKARNYYNESYIQSSETGARRISQLMMSSVPYDDIMASDMRKEIVLFMKDATNRGDTEALFHFGNFIQLGYTQGVLKPYSVSTNILYYKIFIQRLGRYFFPHLKYAFDQLNSYNYKSALVGYLIAAEQGLDKAQISAAWLLYQLDPFPLKDTKQYSHHRVKHAMTYLKRASDQGDMDATIFLGDIYFYGVEGGNITVDYEKSFNLYSKAANSQSPHGCFSLAYMYEHGLGVANNTIDYFMAKRYYDLSLKYRVARTKENNIPIYFALLKIRIKYLIWGQRVESTEEQKSWFSLLKQLGSDYDQQQQQEQEDDTKARQQHENVEGEYWADEEFGFGDFIVLAITVMVFLTFFVRGINQRLRGGGQRRPGEPQQPGNNDNEPWRVEFRGANFEFQFFAL